jgi:DNA mismatch repair protein MutH
VGELGVSPDFDRSDPESILRFGERINGLSIRAIEALLPSERSLAGRDPRASKGAVGRLVEAYFGIRPNQSPEPDFPLAKVELKVVPLKRVGDRIRAKEPTSVSMIDYAALPSDAWERPASVRKKLDRVLFVFIEVRADPMDSSVRGVTLWSPSEIEKAAFRADWERTKGMVAAGRAHELSETQSEVLAARRKGSGGPGERLRTYPQGQVGAKSRAWALKVGFTTQLFDERVLHEQFESALADLPALRRVARLETAEDRALQRLRDHEGESLTALASNLRIATTERKNLAASIIKSLLGFRSVSSRVKEFEQLGTAVKTVHARPSDEFVFESVSFPAVDLVELAKQDWEGIEKEDGTIRKERSDLIDQVQRILFVPTYSPRRDDRQGSRTLGVPFVWTPSPTQWQVIAREWRMFQAEVSEGKAAYDRRPGAPGRRRNRLTPASQTEMIHMRPHGRDSYDEYADPMKNRVTKQCFWLNSQFVQKLLLERDGATRAS